MNAQQTQIGEPGMKIVKLISVTDTREYEEQGDRWVPIPGSGQINQCTRCGKDHEVHALIQLEDGSSAIVGTGCMKAESDDIQRRAKSATSTAKTLARARAELARLIVQDECNTKIRAEVDLLSVPPVRVVAPGKYTPYDMFVGDKRTAAWKDDQSYRESAVCGWRSAALEQRGYRYVASALSECKRRVERLEQKLMEELVTQIG